MMAQTQDPNSPQVDEIVNAVAAIVTQRSSCVTRGGAPQGYLSPPVHKKYGAGNKIQELLLMLGLPRVRASNNDFLC